MTAERIAKQSSATDGPGEDRFWFSRAVAVDGTLYISGQCSVAADGSVVGAGDMRAQFERAYELIGELLAEFGLTPDAVSDETIFVTDMDAARDAAPVVRRGFYHSGREVACTMVAVKSLAWPDLMVEIKCQAVLS